MSYKFHLRDVRARVSLAIRRGASKESVLAAVQSGLEGTVLPLTNYKHGGKGTALYSIWKGMRKRCLNPKSEAYVNYGGRGIRVCKDWDDFVIFRDWAQKNGYREGLSIERNDVNGNYDPTNCSWIPPNEQWKNRRPVRYAQKITPEKLSELRWMRESDVSVRELADYFGVSTTTIYHYV